MLNKKGVFDKIISRSLEYACAQKHNFYSLRRYYPDQVYGYDLSPLY